MFALFAAGACSASGAATRSSPASAQSGARGGGDAGEAQRSAQHGPDAGASSASSDPGADAGFVPPSGEQSRQAAEAYAQGAAAYARGDFAAAAQGFARTYEIFPAPEMAYNLARVYERMGDAPQALRYFERVLQSNPSAAQRTDIEHRVAGLRAYEQRRRDGIAQTLPSTDALSQEGATWFQRGVALYRRRNYRQALIAFEQAYQYLQTPELFYNLAVTHRALHNTDRAIEFLREYLSARRGTPEEAWIEGQIRQLEH